MSSKAVPSTPVKHEISLFGIPLKTNDTVSQDGPLYTLRGYRLYFPKIIVFISLKIDLVLSNSADPSFLHVPVGV